MDHERFRQIRSLFEAALERPDSERSDFLAERCGDDDALRREVEGLLKLDETRVEPLITAIEPAPGDRLGKYELLEEIGRGGTGVVFRARQLSLENEVAVKWLFPSHRDYPGRTARIVTEARLAARLQHPGIVKIFDVLEENGRAWLVMELIPGHTLFDEIREHSDTGELPDGEAPVLPPDSARSYFTRVAELIARAAEALQHAHDRGVVHRDVKPQNLLLDKNGTPLWIDFGLARDLQFGPPDGPGLEGTVFYVSPEQVEEDQRSKLNHRTDVYSLGVVLYELLTLRRPFEGSTTEEILSKLVEREAPPIQKINKRVPRDLALICSVAMRKDPDERYGSAREFADDLRNFIHHRPLGIKPETTFERVHRFTRRHKRKFAIAAACLLAASVGMYVRAAREEYLSQLQVTIKTAPNTPSYNGFYRVIDPATCELSELISLGSGSVNTARLSLPEPAPGANHVALRFIFAFSDTTHAELTRNVSPGETLELVIRNAVPVSRDEMVQFDGGVFLRSFGHEFPLCPFFMRSIVVEPFLLDRYEVTNAQYRQFLLETGKAPPGLWDHLDWNFTGENSRPWDPAWDDLPVAGVSQDDAMDYAEWSGKRLPTHAEWEWAASGPNGNWDYPWGPVALGPGPHRDEAWGPQLAVPLLGNTRGPSESIPRSSILAFEEYVQNVVPVSDHRGDATPEGIAHLLGNVAELSESIAVPCLPGTPLKLAFDECHLLGGAWDAQRKFRTTGKHRFFSDNQHRISHAVGFRCASSVRPITSTSK